MTQNGNAPPRYADVCIFRFCISWFCISWSLRLCFAASEASNLDKSTPVGQDAVVKFSGICRRLHNNRSSLETQSTCYSLKSKNDGHLLPALLHYSDPIGNSGAFYWCGNWKADRQGCQSRDCMVVHVLGCGKYTSCTVVLGSPESICV